MTDLLIARAALRDAVRPKRLLIAALLILLPSLLALVGRYFNSAATWNPEDTYDKLITTLVLGFTLTILSVVNGTGVVSQEVEQRTIVYLLTRPLPRWRILMAKFVVSFTVVAMVSIVATLLLALVVFGPSHFGDAGVWPDIRALLIGSFVYTSLFVLLGTVLPRPLIYGLLFVFGWETLVPSLPGSFARLSVMSYLRVISSREIADTAADAASTGNFLQALTKPPDLEIPLQGAYIILASLAAISLLLATFVFSRREYVPREDAE